MEDILIACVDGLTGFDNAIEAVYPKTEIQQCIIRQIRNTTRFVSYKDIKAMIADLKRIYGAIDENSPLYEESLRWKMVILSRAAKPYIYPWQDSHFLLLIRFPVVHNCKFTVYPTPISEDVRPLFCNFIRGQIQWFEQCRITGKHAPGTV